MASLREIAAPLDPQTIDEPVSRQADYLIRDLTASANVTRSDIGRWLRYSSSSVRGLARQMSISKTASDL